MTVQMHGGETEFHVFRPNARQAFVVGDFNNWDRSALAMTRTKGGEWVCRLRLPEGVYQYKYWVDDSWYVDSGSRMADAFPFGCHSLIVTDAEAPAIPVD